MKRLFVLMVLVAVALIVVDAEAFMVTTADAGGADCELRESSPDSNRGDNIELASRIAAANRNSCVYLKFGVAGITAADLAGEITVRTTYLTNNLNVSRIEDLAGGGPNTGWDYYVMDPTTVGANWDEGTITPNTAPCFSVDGDYSTKGYLDAFTGTPNAGLTYLGQQLYDSADLGPDGYLPVGGAFDFTLGAGSALHDAIVAAQATDHQTLTIVMGIAHEADNPNANWLGFNYIFNSKEVETLKEHPDSPWSAMSNADDLFSPMLTNEPHVPEPATMALLGLGGLLLRRKRNI